MFTNYKRLRKRTGKRDHNRNDYLQLLLNEYRDCGEDEDKQHQTLAHLVNFAYDPINHERIRQLNIHALFVDLLETDEPMNGSRCAMAVAGVCNLVASPLCCDAIARHPRAISLLTRCLLHAEHPDVVMSSATALSHLASAGDDDLKRRVLTPEFRARLTRLATEDEGDVKNRRVINLARALLLMHFPHHQHQVPATSAPVVQENNKS